MISNEQIFDWLSIAKETALKAGKILSGAGQEYFNVDSESGRDIKLQADRESEKIILDDLKEKSSYSILSEEDGYLERKENGVVWIVDPLDGSLNYSRGIPLCCISVGLWKDGEPLLGVVYDFNRHELFTGVVGKGAWLNEKQMAVSLRGEKNRAVLCTGFPVNTNFSTDSLMTFTQKIKDYKKVRLLGSAALSLAYVAAGRADAYMENDIMIWDVAAGIALVKAAGGIVQYNATGRENTYKVRASNKNLVA